MALTLLSCNKEKCDPDTNDTPETQEIFYFRTGHKIYDGDTIYFKPSVYPQGSLECVIFIKDSNCNENSTFTTSLNNVTEDSQDDLVFDDGVFPTVFGAPFDHLNQGSNKLILTYDDGSDNIITNEIFAEYFDNWPPVVNRPRIYDVTDLVDSVEFGFGCTCYDPDAAYGGVLRDRKYFLNKTEIFPTTSYAGQPCTYNAFKVAKSTFTSPYERVGIMVMDNDYAWSDTLYLYNTFF